jgi:hypothetical protein
MERLLNTKPEARPSVDEILNMPFVRQARLRAGAEKGEGAGASVSCAIV